jgi:pyruvate ferredoxin oxidoreductase alpha subunit
MPQTIMDTGNHIAGYACRAARAEVIAAYPITPQSPVVEQIAEFVEKGEMNAKYIRVESEHSAMSACSWRSCTKCFNGQPQLAFQSSCRW